MSATGSRFKLTVVLFQIFLHYYGKSKINQASSALQTVMNRTDLTVRFQRIHKDTFLTNCEEIAHHLGTIGKTIRHALALAHSNCPNIKLASFPNELHKSSQILITGFSSNVSSVVPSHANSWSLHRQCSLQ